MQDAWTGGREPGGQARETRTAGGAGADALSTTGTGAIGLNGPIDGQKEGGADGMRGKAREKAGELKQQARGKRDELKSQALDKKDELKERALSAAEERKGGLTGHVSALAGALEAAASQLEQSDEQRLARIGRDASERVQRMAGYLRDNDLQGLTRDLETTAREHPRAFVASSLAMGLAAGRFLRSSRPEPSYDEGGYAADTDLDADVSAADLSITEPPKSAPSRTAQPERTSTQAGPGAGMGTAGSFGAGTADRSRPKETTRTTTRGNTGGQP